MLPWSLLSSSRHCLGNPEDLLENKNSQTSLHFGGCVALVDGCKVSVGMVVKRRSPPRSPPHLVVVVAGAAVVVVVSSLLEQPRRPPINSNLHYLLSCPGTTKNIV